MSPAAALSSREGLTTGVSVGSGLEDESARFVAAQEWAKCRSVWASARGWARPIAMARPPVGKVVSWIFMHGSGLGS